MLQLIFSFWKICRWWSVS